ncbi:phosphoribosylformylglycinamidine synthase subunit PurS [Desulfurispirillum indicum]|uniref:Phosphoribosylformylglycinamidine synthase subunit PurS n=1 Tax=Desulfurispirillum indicum (strain ATCC BAA-1389 / DSM 22839 / S5) TaxID=653733 RepID=E6W193_DESIS|nr:phosphoribosylformylglycinamidine synthase subunit PurS [Desulfurispirillum indicum]ADU66513.1 phosphoribosylformylglycinamidine synthase, purS [Desulfurispirillum indicum S5]UCZ55846.1 phosphoribosylformylglycinamidine synthase subunit PurS [Desulfurispirillum indicum]
MLARVYVTLKNGVLDPQGKAILGSLQDLGFEDASDVRVGKYIEVQVDATSASAAKERVAQMCQKLLANTVIENYRIEVTEES